MKKKLLASILILAVTIAGCGKLDEKKALEPSKKQQETIVDIEIIDDSVVPQEEDKETEELVEESIEEVAQVEQVQPKETQKTEQKKVQSETPAVTTPAVNAPAAATPEVKECKHNWEEEKVYYDIFKKVTFGCNGCGLALFEWSDDKKSVEHIENLYFHEPCPTDRFPEPCSGGGYHSESVTIGYCGLCSLGVDDPEGRVAYRQCMWTENGKRCIKNEITGTYEKVEYNQNYFMYYDSCRCGKNLIFVNGNDDENSGKGIIYGKQFCTICGLEKEE